jgi:peptidoglycan/LPS O-acetylase OafA/YrhL
MAIFFSMVGATLASKLLEAMTEQQFRSWANRIINCIAGYFVAHGVYLLVLAQGAP